jgi:hypothetical protein
MVPLYIDSTGVTSATSTSTTLIAPSGIVDGDFLIIIFTIAIGVVPTFPAGFSEILVCSDSVNFDNYVGIKVAASESGNYIVTNTSAVTQGWIGCYRNLLSIGSSYYNENNSAGPITISIGITTFSNDNLILFFSQDQNTNSLNLAVPSGTTPTFTKRFGETGINPSFMYVADGILASTGATGIITLDNNNGSTDAWSGFVYAFPPTPGAPTALIGGAAANNLGIIGTGSAGNEYGNNNNNALPYLLSSAPWPVSLMASGVRPGVVNPGSTAVLGAIPQAGQRPSRAYN